MRKIQHVTGEYYHVYNRGVDKRSVFLDRNDLNRFLKTMLLFNASEPLGGVHVRHSVSKPEKLVSFVCYCLNPNHFHFLLRQEQDRGIEKFMQRVGNGYTKYFNARHKRSGVLFQGPFQSVRMESSEQLLYTSVYVNANDRVHYGDGVANVLSDSSWDEYFCPEKVEQKFCRMNITLDQFDGVLKYKEYTEETIKCIRENKTRETPNV